MSNNLFFLSAMFANNNNNLQFNIVLSNNGGYIVLESFIQIFGTNFFRFFWQFQKLINYYCLTSLGTMKVCAGTDFARTCYQPVTHLTEWHVTLPGSSCPLVE
jgi:hypothetical protein